MQSCSLSDSIFVFSTASQHYTLEYICSNIASKQIKKKQVKQKYCLQLIKINKRW